MSRSQNRRGRDHSTVIHSLGSRIETRPSAARSIAANRKPIAGAGVVKVVAGVPPYYYLLVNRVVVSCNGGASVNRSLAILAFASLGTACTITVNTNDSPTGATEASLMQANRDFAVATHSRGIDGWMSFYAPDAIRIRYRGNTVAPRSRPLAGHHGHRLSGTCSLALAERSARQEKTPYPFGVRGWLLAAHPSYKLDQ